MPKTFIDHIREKLAADGLSARAAARNAGMPERSVQGVMEGHSPSLERARQICEALGLELYIGPPRPLPTIPDLYFERPVTDTEVSESRSSYGVRLVSLPLDELEQHVRGIVRLVLLLGGDPFPADLDDLRAGREINEATLADAIAAAEKGLQESGKTMSPEDKAYLSVEAYKILEAAQDPEEEPSANVIQLIQKRTA